MSKQITRRGFLHTGAAAGVAAVTAPYFVPARAMGANDRIVLGSIGVGNQGGSLVRSFARQCAIAAIADVYLPRAREVAAAVGAKDAYQDYRQLLDRKDIDAVIVATPLRWHALNCIHAAQAGKDIYCEKPLTYTIVEGRRIVEAVRKYKRVLQTGSQQRSGGHEYTGCTYVRNGAIGKVTRVLASNYCSPMEPQHPEQEIPEGLDWDMWCGPAEKPPYNFVIWDNRSNPSWVSIRPFSGGEMTDWGSHGLDMAQWGLGMDEIRNCRASRRLQRPWDSSWNWSKREGQAAAAWRRRRSKRKRGARMVAQISRPVVPERQSAPVAAALRAPRSNNCTGT